MNTIATSHVNGLNNIEVGNGGVMLCKNKGSDVSWGYRLALVVGPILTIGAVVYPLAWFTYRLLTNIIS